MVKLNNLNSRFLNAGGLADEDYFAKAIDKHELIRNALEETGSADVYDVDGAVLYRLVMDPGYVTIAAALPDRGVNAARMGALFLRYVVGHTFCYHADYMARTDGMNTPLRLFADNYDACKRSDRVGCVHCGAIFNGKATKIEYLGQLTDFDGDDAVCPVCGKDFLVAEESGAEVNGDTLYRWNQKLFGGEDTPGPSFDNNEDFSEWCCGYLASDCDEDYV